MTKEEIRRLALLQSAIDMNADPVDFLKDTSTVVISKKNEKARKYLKLPFLCDIVWYGHGVVASVAEEYRETVEKYVNAFPPEHLFETPNLHVLNDAFAPQGRVCFMAEYFLPDPEKLKKLDCPYKTRLLGPKDFEPLYVPAWENALCKARKELDVLGLGAYDEQGKLIGLAACSADCESMWQIGVDVLPEHRRKGIASCLTANLAIEIISRGKVPFYCAAWSNVRSVRSALRAGFTPAWVELTVKSRGFVDEINGLVPDVTLRPAEENDLEAIVKLYREAAMRPDSLWDDEYPTVENARRDLACGCLFAAEYEDELIGAISVETEPDDSGICWHSPTGTTLARLVCAERVRGRGFGKSIMETMISALREQGCPAVRLLVGPENTAAVRTYEKLGFTECGHTEKYGLAFQAMELLLNEK